MTTTAFLRRALIEPAVSLRDGGVARRAWRELEKTQWRSTDELLAIQAERVRRLAAHVYGRNDFYRKRFDAAGVAPGDLRTAEDLRALPILTKAEVREAGEAMVSRGFRGERLLEFRTGGSTGKPLRILITEACSERRNACARRHDRWSGWEVGEPVAAVWGNPTVPSGLKARARAWLTGPHLYLDTMDVTESSVRRFETAWRRIRPTLLFGHAHSLYLLARLVEELGLTGIRPRAAISSSMMLLDVERAVIERAFGVRVFDRYGCEEVSLVASECDAHRGMHLNVEHLVVEFLGPDGKPVGPGERGRIVVTDLMNDAMPFIRYEVEDEGEPLSGSCACGRGLPLMGRVTGRLADFLVRKDGSRVAGVSLIENSLTRIPHIEQMQIVQESLDLLRLRVVAGARFGPAEREALTGYFRGLFGPEVTVTLDEVDRIAPEGSARKFRFCISRVDAGAAAGRTP